MCGHLHSDTEWKPRDLPDGSRWLLGGRRPNTQPICALCLLLLAAIGQLSVALLCFAFSVCLLLQMTGDWRPLFTLDSRVFREWATPAVAGFLGLRITSHCPVCVHVRDVWSRESDIPSDVIYVRHGHFSQR